MKTIKLTAALLALCLVMTVSVQSQQKADGNVTAFGNSSQYNNAVYLSQSTPGEMAPGQSYPVSVTMKNSGSSVWRQGNYTLKLTNSSDVSNKTWSLNSVDVASSVNSGEQVVFNFSVTAPQTEGSYNLQWQMAEGSSFFGEPSATAPIRVVSLTSTAITSGIIKNNAAFVSQKVPSDMEDGQTYDVTVIMKNTGSTTWKPGVNKLLVSTKGGDNTGAWTVANVELSSEVYADMEVTFNFKVTAPKTDGNYNFQCQIAKDGTFFGEPSTNVIVNVH